MKRPSPPSVILLVVLLIMLDTLRRLFGDSRPIDMAMLVIELLVLALIAYEVTDKLVHRWKLERRKKMLLRLLAEAQELQQAAFTLPEANDNASVIAWWNRVQPWERRTNEQLSRYSKQAAGAFMYSGSRPDKHYMGVAIGAQVYYGMLMWRMESLRNILEKIGAYF